MFWFSILFIAYTYIGYPCLLFLWARLFPKKVNKAFLSPAPEISIIIAARNEENNIRERIDNLVCQNYPQEKMEIIVVSDGSTDATNTLVHDMIYDLNSLNPSERSFLGKIKLIEMVSPKGKPYALNAGVDQAMGEFIVFADARQRFEKDAIQHLIANFHDPTVGCVSGELVFYEETHTTIRAEMGAYWNYEKRIRKMEGLINSVAGATGAIYAARKSLLNTIPEETILDDVFVPMQVVFQGYRTIFDDGAIAYDKISDNLSTEQRRKIRTLLGNYQLLNLMPSLMSPTKNSIFVQFVSHKIFRLLVPFFFLIATIVSPAIDGIVYHIIFLLLVLILISPFMGCVTQRISVFEKGRRLAQAFVYLNYFAVIAFIKFMRKDGKTVW